MTKEWKIVIGIATSIIALCAVCLCPLSFASFFTFSRGNQNADASACPPLPKDFTESDLVGTWIGKYFGNIDRLIIRADGTYKQIYKFNTNEPSGFESDWQEWRIEYDPHGYIRLHLTGMRRCDGLDSECNNPGGGLPSGDLVINPCEETSLTYPKNEVILFVTGSLSNVPRGIMFQQAKLAGSDWSYTFRLEK